VPAVSPELIAAQEVDAVRSNPRVAEVGANDNVLLAVGRRT